MHRFTQIGRQKPLIPLYLYTQQPAPIEPFNQPLCALRVLRELREPSFEPNTQQPVNQLTNLLLASVRGFILLQWVIVETHGVRLFALITYQYSKRNNQ